MAIELITGLPGNAKTLKMIELAIQRSTAENRPVYYAGIKGFQQDDPRLNGVPWTEFDPLTWYDTVPSGSIIVIDEGQKVFRARTLGAVPGKHVTELEEHRHKGLDFFMTTQHPGLIDPAIRKLTQVHRHMMRISGFEASTVHTWTGQVKDNCDKPAGRRDSEKQKWGFNKSLYGIYHSADMHTMKRTIPARVKLLGGLLVVFALLAYYMFSFVHKKTGAQDSLVAAGPVQTAADRSAQVPASQVAQVRPFDPIEDAKNYVQQNLPRVAGLPHTAPKYDEITAPTRAPVPKACIQIGSAASGKTPRCKCYTQAGTPMEVEFNMCINIAQNGYFLDFDPDGKDERRQDDTPAQMASSRPAPDVDKPWRGAVFDAKRDGPGAPRG